MSPMHVIILVHKPPLFLDKANFRVVRNVEAIVEVNNSNLKRKDVEKSAYGQLLRNARLTGSQVLINVVIEEIRRESSSFLKQYVAARATVIEFLQDNGEPIKSVYQPQPTSTTSTEETSQPTTIATEEPVQEVVEVVEVKELTPEEQENANYAYLAYLAFIRELDVKKATADGLDIQRITRLYQTENSRQLKAMSEGHSEDFERYKK